MGTYLKNKPKRTVIGLRISKVRASTGLSRRLFAEKIGTTQYSILDYELKGMDPLNHNFIKIINAYPEYTLYMLNGNNDPITQQLIPKMRKK